MENAKSRIHELEFLEAEMLKQDGNSIVFNEDFNRKKAFYKALKIAGGSKKLAAAIGCKAPQVAYWWRVNGRVKAEFVLAVESATGVSRHELRNDIYPTD